MSWLTFFFLVLVIAGPLVAAEKAAVACSLMLACVTTGLAWGLRLAGEGAMTFLQIVIFTVAASVVTAIAFATLSQESHGSSAPARNTRYTRRTCHRSSR